MSRAPYCGYAFLFPYWIKIMLAPKQNRILTLPKFPVEASKRAGAVASAIVLAAWAMFLAEKFHLY